LETKQNSATATAKQRQLRLLLRVCAVLLIAGGLFAALMGTTKRALHVSEAWQQVLGPPASYFTDESKPLRTQTVRVELGNRVFNIPLMYINSRKAPTGVYKDSIILEVIWPDMRSIYELKDKQEYERIWRQEGRRGWILIHSASERPPLDLQVRNMQESMTKFEDVGMDGSLHRYLWYRGTTERPELQHEVFLERDATGHITNYIDCDPIDRGVYPQCRQEFISRGLLYSLTYRRSAFLLEWRQQQHRAINFLRSFETTSSNQQQHGG